MGANEARAAFDALARAAFDHAVETGVGIEPFQRRSAYFDTRYDEMVSSLAESDPALEAIEKLPEFGSRLSESARVALQLVYEFFTRLPSPEWDASICESVFTNFLAELEDPNWTFVLLGNLTSFQSDLPRIDLGDGVSIRHRDLDMLRADLGWGDWELDALTRDWMDGMRASVHILWVEDAVPKTPETLALSNSVMGYRKAERALRAMWLTHAGDVQVGHLFHAVKARVRLKPGGLGRTGIPVRNFFGATFTFAAEDIDQVRDHYEVLTRLEALAEDAPGNVLLAVRRFSAMYSRGVQQREDRVLDAITALEALLGSEDELTFKLSFRVASLLAGSDDERSALFKAMKGFYRTRSKIVHGGTLKQADLDLITDDSALRDVVRRVLRSVIHLTLGGEYILSRRFVNEQLDTLLLHSEDRDRLRTAMGLLEA